MILAENNNESLYLWLSFWLLNKYYETIFNRNFKGYENHIRNQAIPSAIKAELDDIHFECDLLKSHIKSDIKKDLISNGFFVKKARKSCTNAECKY